MQGAGCGVRGKSAGLKCRDFVAGQKCRVTCKVQSAGLWHYVTGLVYSGLTTGEGVVMSAIAGYCAK